MTKTYRSLVYKDLDIYIVVNGIKTLTQFRGGSLQPPVNGIFSTSNPDYIKAMDKDSSNGIAFACIRSEGVPEKAKTKTEPEGETKVSGTPEPAEKKTVPGITNLQEAKEYLLKNIEGLTMAKMPNAKSVTNLAEKYEIEFPDLKGS